MISSPFHQIYAQLRLKTRSFFLGHRPQGLKTDASTHIHSDVAQALHAHRPAVAPESTTATHGISYPVNLETAKFVERNVSISESIPATVDPTDGRQNSSHASSNDWQNARINL